MAKKIWNVTEDLAESLNYLCPNCGGALSQKRSYLLVCEDCSYSYAIITRNEKMAYILLSGLIFAFGAGWLLALLFRALL